jgi:hypothetical protein
VGSRAPCLEEPGTLGAANGLTEAAYALIELGRIDEAKKFASDGLVSARRLGVAQPIGDSFRGLAWCALLERTPHDAVSALLEQLAAFEQADGMIDRVVEVGLSTALAAADAGDAETARSLWNRTQATLDVLDVSIDNWPVELRRRGDALGDAAVRDAGPAGAPPVALSDLMVTVREVLRRLAATPLPNPADPVPS